MLDEMLSTGFIDWTPEDYQSFLGAFKTREIDDFEGIAT